MYFTEKRHTSRFSDTTSNINTVKQELTDLITTTTNTLKSNMSNGYNLAFYTFKHTIDRWSDLRVSTEDSLYIQDINFDLIEIYGLKYTKSDITK